MLLQNRSHCQCEGLCRMSWHLGPELKGASDAATLEHTAMRFNSLHPTPGRRPIQARQRILAEDQLLLWIKLRSQLQQPGSSSSLGQPCKASSTDNALLLMRPQQPRAWTRLEILLPLSTKISQQVSLGLNLFCNSSLGLGHAVEALWKAWEAAPGLEKRGWNKQKGYGNRPSCPDSLPFESPAAPHQQPGIGEAA